jgi:hypothetical protein
MGRFRRAATRWQEIRRGRRPQIETVTIIFEPGIDREAVLRAARREINRQRLIGTGTLV